ncbi:MAG: PilZ domain-containing protein [Planctomycetota bacterium]|nr:MAG: PilZ domain-containing protein [Planctomycetota bacterium]
MHEYTGNPSDRRADTRFPLKPMYSGIEVKLTGEDQPVFEGHAYDISRSGVNFELDQAIQPGTPICLKLTLPEWLLGLVDGDTDLTSVQIRGTVVWQDDDGVPGPVRMAATFQSFNSVSERDLFLETLKSHRYAVAA